MNSATFTRTRRQLGGTALALAAAMRSLVFCLVAAALGACGRSPSFEIMGTASTEGVSVADGFTSSLFPTSSPPLHTPYVVGGQIVITVSSYSGQNLTGWTLSSSDTSVLAVTSPLEVAEQNTSQGVSVDGYVATLSAVRAGNANLIVSDAAGVPVATEAVSVAAPDHATVYAPVKLLAGASSSQAELSQAAVVVGGKSTFLVQYFSGGTRLYGTGALSPVATSGTDVTTTSPSTSPVDDFLYVSPATVDPAASVSLLVGGTSVGTLAINAVGAESIAGMAVDQTVLNGLGVLYAHAKDASGGDIYGATFNWTTTGQDEDGKTNDPAADPSDLYCYSLATSTQSDGTLHITASYGSFVSETTVSGEPFLFTSTAVMPSYDNPNSCSVSGAPGTERRSGCIFGVGLALALVGVGRRRRIAKLAGRSLHDDIRA